MNKNNVQLVESKDSLRDLEIKHMLKYGDKEGIEFIIYNKVRESDFKFAKALWKSSGIMVGWNNLMSAARDFSDREKACFVEFLEEQIDKTEGFNNSLGVLFDLSWSKTTIRKCIVGRFVTEDGCKKMMMKVISDSLSRIVLYAAPIVEKIQSLWLIDHALSYMDKDENFCLLVMGQSKVDFLDLLNGLAWLERDVDFYKNLSKDDLGIVDKLLKKLNPSVFKRWIEFKLQEGTGGLSEKARRKMLKMEQECLIGNSAKNEQSINFKRKKVL